jgi:hypothetical protein
MFNGVYAEHFTILPQLSQRDLAREMRNTDCGLFPNRCEGGTNLVLMEYLSCRRRAAANLFTGHQDLSGECDIRSIDVEYDKQHWAKQDVSDIVEALEDCYHNAYNPWGDPPWTWASTADTIMSALTELKQTSNLAA